MNYKQIKNGVWYNDDCLEVMKTFADKSVDVVISDLPYGSTACVWDNIIPFDELWFQYKRICKYNVVLFGSQPFTTTLIMSNLKYFKYSYVWEKNFSTNFFHAKRMPLRKTEDICVFEKGLYFPQKTQGHQPTQSAKGLSTGKLWHGTNKRDYAGGDTSRYPTNIIKINTVDPKKRIHPTQKPIELLEYLIKTHSTENMVILDNCAGSGTTAIACENTNRRWICIEKDQKYSDLGIRRIDEHK